MEKLNDDDRTPLCVVALANNTNLQCGGIVNHLVEFGADVCAPCPTANGTALPYEVAEDFVVKTVSSLQSMIMSDLYSIVAGH